MTEAIGEPFDDEAVLELCRRRRGSDRRFQEPDYLDWLYRRNPEGPAVHAEVERDGKLLAHVAAVPQTWWTGRGEQQLGLLVNFMATGDGRSLGHLPELLRRLRRAGIERGAPGAFAVTNASSTAIALRVLKGRLLAPLPVVIGRAPRGGEGVDSGPLRDEDDALIERWQPPATGWYQRWTSSSIRWRLARPGATYALHRTADALAISSTTTVFGVRFAVLAKVLRLDDGGGTRSTVDLVAAACAHHGARAFVHAGIESQLTVRGLRPPRRILPSPLNLLYLPAGDEPGPDVDAIASFSFLDFDAY